MRIARAVTVALVCSLAGACSSPSDEDRRDASEPPRDAGGVDAGDAGGGDADAGELDGGSSDAGAGSDGGTPSPVGWCRLQHPDAMSVLPGTGFPVYARLFVPSLTDRTAGIDLAPGLVGQVGFGPRATLPDGWTWTDGAPNDGWNADTAGESGNDEWQAELVAPEPGEYDYAFRFSTDGGGTWTTCDWNAGPGADGSEDGYQAEHAGRLTVRDPCAPNPCDAPPPATCDHPFALRTFASPGTCSRSGAAFECAYAAGTEDCAAAGKICDGGACVFAPAPRVDWCRHQHPTAATVVVGQSLLSYGRVYASEFTDLTDRVDEDARLVGQLGVGPRGSDPATAAGWRWVASQPSAGWSGTAQGEPNNDEYAALLVADAAGSYDLAWRFSLDGGVSWTWCDGADQIGSDGSENGYQVERAGHLEVLPDPCAPNPCTNAPQATCADATTLQSFPSPGTCSLSGLEARCDYPAVEADCAASGAVCEAGRCVSPVVDWCRLQWPATIAAAAGTEAVLFGRFHEAGLTDRGHGNDVAPGLRGQAGYGPDGSHPATASGWTWVDAAPNAAWNAEAAGEAGNDEWSGRFSLPSPGLRNHAFRFSLDAGRTWTYCDLDRRSAGGADGSNDGYQPENAGQLESKDPCDPNPCTQPPTASTCLDASTVRSFSSPGVCSAADGAASCMYAPTDVTCAEGTTCEAGTCVDATVDWCRLQWPRSITEAEGSAVAVYARFFEAGLTNQHAGNDTSPRLRAQAGYGPDQSNPSGAGWTWIAAAPNPGWNADTAGEPGNDEWTAALVVPAQGTWDYAFRFSLDEGRSWRTCDLDARGSGGGDGSVDGYQPANAGALVSTARH